MYGVVVVVGGCVRLPPSRMRQPARNTKHATPHRAADECLCIACVRCVGGWDRGWGGAWPWRTLEQRVGVHAKVVSGLQLRQGVRLGLQVPGDVGQQLLRLLQLQGTLRRVRGRWKGCTGVVRGVGGVYAGQTKERHTNAWAYGKPSASPPPLIIPSCFEI